MVFRLNGLLGLCVNMGLGAPSLRFDRQYDIIRDITGQEGSVQGSKIGLKKSWEWAKK